MRFEITPLVEADLSEIVEIEEITGLNRWGYDAYRRELLTNSGAVMFVARPLDYTSGRRTIGYVAGAILYDELHINNIATHPDYRRLGVASALLSTALDEGVLRGATQCVLEVRASNVVAQALYHSFGFHVNRRRKEYYRGPTEDALEMLLDVR
jgi:[ribosomal protein S18]-alanine N-acetyltransferase